MARFWIFFLAAGLLVVFNLSRYTFNSLSNCVILTSIESIRPPTPWDASPSDGGGGPGAFFLPNTLFILCVFQL